MFRTWYPCCAVPVTAAGRSQGDESLQQRSGRQDLFARAGWLSLVLAQVDAEHALFLGECRAGRRLAGQLGRRGCPLSGGVTAPGVVRVYERALHFSVGLV